MNLGFLKEVMLKVKELFNVEVKNKREMMQVENSKQKKLISGEIFLYHTLAK